MYISEFWAFTIAGTLFVLIAVLFYINIKLI